MTDTSRTDAYSHFLTRPVWPKAHRTRLEDEYQGSSAEELERESIQRGHHHPLKTSITSGNRPAGTSGAVYGSYRHPDDFDHVEEDADEELKTALEKHIGKQGSRISQEERDELLKTIKDAGKPEQVREDFKKLLDDPSIVISARDVKGLTPDFASKEGHAKMHGWARYIMPISEAELKGQNWEGKEEQEREAQKKKEDQEAQNKKSVSQDGDKSADKSNGDAKPKAENGDAKSGQNGDSSSTQGDGKQSKNNNSESKSADETDKKGGKSATDQKTNREQDNGAEHGDSTDDMTPTQRRFMDELIAEANAIAAFKNATGEPKAVSDPDGLSQVGYEIQVDDQSTPDNWVPRSDHLLRLTGKHPLNAEADLRHLWDAGMVTPVKYHYVRNHGSVPKLLWEHHTLEVFSDPPGLLSDPHDFTMDEIAEMKCVEIPVTIACDGNRRGEVNMIKRSGGFTWGSSGVSTCRWKGVLVRDILLACGLQDVPAGERLYLNYEGADEPSEGKYATSIPLAHALNPQNDVLLAYSINGRVLSPDHGYPIRSIIPGYVGGRQVKWLKKLWITKKPNDSHYHIWDNRFIPSFVTDKNSIEGKAFFHHPDTACNEQILQSVIARPSQGECIPLTLEECKQNDNIFDGDDEHSDDPLSKMYRVQGFAYNGGGNIVQRVELSLDGGRSWRYCFRKFLDEPLRHGEKYWTWVFWHVDVTIRELCQATELCVRAFDAYKNTQPEHISWNLMGMMNNAWYRLRGRTDTDPKTKLPCLTWKHPIAPGGKEGGWMKPSPEEQAKQEAASAAQAGPSKEFTLEEVEKHNTEKDCWIILDGKVYDATSVLAWHPGGASAIMTYAGKATAQATADYNAIHDAYAQKKTQEVLIGKLSDKGVQALKQDSERVAKQQKELAESRKPFALRPFKYFPATLVKRQEVSDDTRIYTFKLPDVDGKAGRLGLPICKHVQIASHWQDSVAMRPYTPIRPVLSEEEDGTFDLLIKTYFPEASPFPPGGTLGNYLDVLNVGEQIDINGPVGDITYLGKGEFEVEGEKYTFDKINLVAGGSGITPHWQLIHAILKEEDDKTQVSLIDSNKSIGDILLYKELQKYAEEHTDQFKLWMTLSHKPEKVEWKYSVGHLDEQMMRDHFFMPKDGERVGTFLCGPPGLIKHGAMPALKKIGFEEGKTVFGF